MKRTVSVYAVVLFAAAAAAETRTPAQPIDHNTLQAQGARLLTRGEVEKLVSGSQMSLADGRGGTQSWTQGLRGNVVASLRRAGSSRALNGQGTGSVDESGAYCVRIEWPREVESWCRRVWALRGLYYVATDQTQEGGPALLQVLRPDPSRFTLLSRMWSLARVAGSGVH